MTSKSLLCGVISIVAFSFGVASAAQISVKVSKADGDEFYPVQVDDLAALVAHLEAHCAATVRLGISVQGSDDDYVSDSKSAASLDASDFSTLLDSGAGYSHFIEANSYDPRGKC